MKKLENKDISLVHSMIPLVIIEWMAKWEMGGPIRWIIRSH